MFFSKACEYGIRAALYVVAQKGVKVKIKEACETINTPEPFTAKVMQTLTKAQIISSAKGPSGGFYITEQQQEHSLFDLVKAIDGDHIFTKCGLGLETCSSDKPCPVHNQFVEIREQLIQTLKEASLTNMTDKLDSGLFFIKKS